MSDKISNTGLYKSEYEHDSCGTGFVADIKGKKSHDIVIRGLEVLERMEHRGAESADNKTGDGAGILTQMPHSFFKSEIKNLPEEGLYGAGIVFLPKAEKDTDNCIKEFEKILAEENLSVLAWRKIETDSSVIGNIAKASEPEIKQIFVTGKNVLTQNELELKLYIARKHSENKIRNSSISGKNIFYIPSLSTKTIVYKGMLMPDQLRKYFADLRNEKFESAIAMVHSRFSTNTFPSWDLAQPFRMISHNGEINTVKGNRFWMSARESKFNSPIFGDEIKKIFPVIEPGKSDSASFDNALEMLVMTGRSLPHTLMMLIPESWNDKNPIPQDLKYFYEYHSTFMEPWDGPASIVFSDGRYVGGTLDRNGLRPSRYIITKDDLIVMGSEVGVQTFPARQIAHKGRLKPGKILLVDTLEGRIIPDEELKEKISHQKPYRQWVELNRINLADLPNKNISSEIDKKRLHDLQILYGYNREDLNEILYEMGATGQEPTGSMGTDTPLAVFSEKPQKLYNYFKQVFAQVTNPSIDPIREEIVMSLTSYIGPEKNLLDESPDNCKMIKFLKPVFSNEEVDKIRSSANPDFKSTTLDIIFPAADGDTGLEKAMENLCISAEEKIDEGYKYIFLSDKKVDEKNIPIPSLLAVAGLHHHLIRVKKRTSIGLIIETAEPREVMHFALLFGYGAGAVNPYGAYASLYDLHKNGQFPSGMPYNRIESNFIKAIEKGLLKVLSKMGTSTLRSYRGAQIFEALGLGRELVEKYFTGTDTRIGGIGIKELARETIMMHEKAFIEKPLFLESEGVYSYRKDGEKHAWNPDTIRLLQWATRSNDYKKFKEFSALVNSENQHPHVIRGMFDFKKQTPISIDEVEPVENILKRLTTGAMSFGSLGKDVHEAMAVAMNTIGGRSNSGEGGEEPERFLPRPDGTSARSSIKQVASGRFGVTSNYLVNADEIQIKISQGAKPGEGGQLPGHKVDKIIAKTRHSTAGVTLISPPPHHDIYSIEDLAQLIFDLKNANPRARISVKLVAESGVGTIAAGVTKAHADNILISGYDGGTGASPISSIKHAGIPFELGIAETHQTLVLNDLRGRVRLQADGQLKTGRDIVIAGMLGAEEFGFGTSALIVLGCVMMRKCHLNTCPVGVATQDPELRKRFRGKPEYLINYFTFIAAEAREIMAELGIRKFDDLVGRTDLLEIRKIDHWKAKTVDPSAILFRPAGSDKNASYCIQNQVHKIENVIDIKLISETKESVKLKNKIILNYKIGNVDRAVGAMLSGEISKIYGDDGLPEDTITVNFEGSAGQSFGAFLAPGVTFRLEGDANDYFGKGLSGGKLIAVPPKGSDFIPEENIIIGNTVLYGATAGDVFIRGIAGERFCVRNSGVNAVIEGTGDHCAEYMTGGKLIVIGDVGRNFAAGMSGGIAYVLDKKGNFDYYCNRGMVELSLVEEKEDIDFIKKYLQKHIDYTQSSNAKNILENWDENIQKFIKVIPLEYKRALQEMKLELINRELNKIKDEEHIGDYSDG